jgi:uncharacterized protein
MDLGVASRLAAVFATWPSRVAAAYVFGSTARGHAGATSDIDVGVLYAAPLLNGLAGLPVELEEALSRAVGGRVDLVVLDSAPVDLIHRVLRDGRLVHEADRSRRIAFEVRSRAMYFDLLPVLREYRRPRDYR